MVFCFRGVITVTPDGKRHVSLGRGYTLHEYPEPYPKIEECISKIYEQRNNVRNNEIIYIDIKLIYN